MRRFVPAIFALLLSAAVAQATTIVIRSTDQLFHDADVVAVAQIHDVRAVQGHGHITTVATMVISEGLKGAHTGETVQVLVPGGSVGRWGQHVEGAPSVAAGESCVVFLSRTGDTAFRFTGMEQGKLLIATDPEHPDTLVVHRTASAQFVERAPDGTLREATLPPETEPLKPFLDHLRQLSGGAP